LTSNNKFVTQRQLNNNKSFVDYVNNNESNLFEKRNNKKSIKNNKSYFDKQVNELEELKYNNLIYLHHQNYKKLKNQSLNFISDLNLKTLSSKSKNNNIQRKLSDNTLLDQLNDQNERD